MRKIGASPAMQKKIDYAYHISEGDKTFVALLEAENSAWTHDLKHTAPYWLCWNHQAFENKRAPNQEFNQHRCRDGQDGWFWRKHYDFGFCGTGDGYKKHIVDDPRFFSDWKWQMEQCLDMYRTGTTFHGMDNVKKTRTRFVYKNTIAMKNQEQKD